MLVLSMGYHTLGGQQAQMHPNWIYHKKGLQLFSLIRCSLATNQILLPKDPDPASPGVYADPGIRLNNLQVVGLLVPRIDTWLSSINQVLVALDGTFARQTFDTLFQSQSQTQAGSPAGISVPTPP